MNTFVVRLIPPRPTFRVDMTPDERALMVKHAAYWTDLLNQGKVLIFGPVDDPKGPWGIAIVHAEHVEEVRKYTAADPVASGAKFIYEILPMLRAVIRP